jgi:hypothetical protein
MGSHPINLTIRFLLEIIALLVLALWGWRLSSSWLRIVLALGIPIITAAAWGIFAVPDDPSRSGAAPIAVPGFIRLALELLIFTLATWAVYKLGFKSISWVFAFVIIIHYLSSYDRILWLIKQ